MAEASAIARHKTALRRSAHSRPVALALEHGLIGGGVTVFDYGCGHGEDVRLLREAGVEAEGWDPHHRPEAGIREADVVNLGYVLNVIEDPAERSRTLAAAFELARVALIVAVRVDRALDAAEPYADGRLTRRGSFQKLYTQAEFLESLSSGLGRRPHVAGLGIAYVFRDEAAEARHLASQSIRRPPGPRADWVAQFAKDTLARRYLALARRLGRLPLPSEFKSYGRLADRFGSAQRVERLAERALTPESLEEARRRRGEDILAYFAMLRLQGVRPPPFRVLPPEARADVKMLWSSYAEALERADGLLFELGKPELVRAACERCPVGKRLPADLYVHRSGEEQLPTLLKLLLFAARQVVGALEYDLVKLALDGRKLSFLAYEDFDGLAHPPLRSSVLVDLPRAGYGVRDYSASDNPPILHRKDAFVDPVYPLHPIFAELSRQEEELGLLSRPDIGHRKAWEALLLERGLRVEGHRLLKVEA